MVDWKPERKEEHFDHGWLVTRKGQVEALDHVRMWTIDGLPIEEKAQQQIVTMAQLPILAGPIAIMPDVHWGKGATVGSVVPTRGAIIPAAVGVDIGCGMAAIRTNITVDQLPDTLASMRSAIEAAIPVGFASHKNDRVLDDVLSLDTHQTFEQRLRTLRERYHGLLLSQKFSKKVQYETQGVLWKQIGTLGGGNHFIEVQMDQEGTVWLMLHSGSRHVGKVLAEVAIQLARQESEGRGDTLPDPDLAWLVAGSESFAQYITALAWAQDYARTNRDMMLSLLWNAVAPFLPQHAEVVQSINCHHNYVEEMTIDGSVAYVTRKGAVSARRGEWGIIPGSMGTHSYIVRGKGNPDSYFSCSHGAGRQMSRGEAKRRFTTADLESQTAGVESRKDAAIVDEIPAAYKDIDAVMAAQHDLVEPVYQLKQLLCVKG
ncbi:RtcB family protein [Sulfobacillus sp. hq2]|uniref:RtcB family protein n=1 Tax=Sulfobacillus TaxID=28033 RepID=UPI000CD1B010|nr:RtcB family protein [Sulfobacillus sp. hq2]POB11876.1 RNA-splicing ligase RtcB [Sulfobacillus sp. hq2]